MGPLTLLHRAMVWSKATPIAGVDDSFERLDAFGNRIRWDDYGDRNSRFGWEIDHITPEAVGGSDMLDNLRPLHFRANASLGGIVGALLSTR